jgi:predicted XRE-type DNA-binding protein
MSRLDSVIDDLGAGRTSEARPGSVSSLEGTIPRPNPQMNPSHGQPMPADVDALFGAKQAYLKIKGENFQHRLLLWYKLQGFKNVECARLLGYTQPWVSNVTRQPWFQHAFCALASEMGKDAVDTFLEGTVMPALEQVAHLSQSGESDAIKLAASKEILDRYLGKSVAKTEIKSDSKIDVNVYEGAKLKQEYEDNLKILAGRGIGSNN